MKKFWGFYENDNFKIGCNGASIYVYNKNDIELARFKDIRYAYTGQWMPNQNIFVAKSTEGSLAIYDLDNLKLIKKFYITHIGAQDEGFSCTPDGKYFYNIEKPKISTITRLTKYDTLDWSYSILPFSQDENIVLQYLEFDKETGIGYLLGFIRRVSGLRKGEIHYGFVSRLVNDEMINLKRLDYSTFEYVRAYKSFEEAGFTEKRLEWSSLKDYKIIKPVSLKELWENTK